VENERRKPEHSPVSGIILMIIYSFINTTAGCIKLLLLSSSGLVKIPVGAWYASGLLANSFSDPFTDCYCPSIAGDCL
jgi:hypothetical protein